ncbi:hypothetical protein CTheo_2680 [Ceratobasidium theobromae]|uniref:Transmembrane protein n=1 Tax=Ceratobasidium theobromae TaxID=1582974 RepID=A0A5N5QQD3_9AGAM|nr:hypothetical protein CTheo_2680 [Ceratobasidium theobromae]
MSSESIYDSSRVIGTVTAGIFTGLAASAPLYTIPSLLNQTSYDRARPASDLEKFEEVNKAVASSLNWAGISGVAFLVAAYTAPANVAFNRNYIGRGAGEIGFRLPSDRLASRITSSRGLLLTAGVGLIALFPFSVLVVRPIAKATLNMRVKLQAEQIAGTGAGVPNRGQNEFNNQLRKWNAATKTVAFLGFVATVSGTLHTSQVVSVLVLLKVIARGRPKLKPEPHFHKSQWNEKPTTTFRASDHPSIIKMKKIARNRSVIRAATYSTILEHNITCAGGYSVFSLESTTTPKVLRFATPVTKILESNCEV